MPPEGLFEESGDETRAEIMEATYRALVEYGYAGLSVQRIANRFDKSKSLVYHHYDGKDDLLVDFLGFVLDAVERDIATPEEGTAPERLRRLFDGMFPTDPAASDEFVGVFVELRAQAVHDDDYREQITENDRSFRAFVADIVADGVENGTLREVDPDRAAAFLVSLIDAAMTERTTADDPEALERVRSELDAYVAARLLPDEE